MATDVNSEEQFDKDFEAAALAAEQDEIKPVNKEEPAVEVKELTPEEKTAADKAVADAAAADKAAKDAEDAKAALEAMTPEERAAKETADAAAEKTRKAGEEAEARIKAKAETDAAAKAKADADAKAAAAAIETPEKKLAREKLEEAIRPYEPTPEEKKALEEFKKEFPDSAAAVEAQLKSVDKEVNRRVYEMASVLKKEADSRLVSLETVVSEMQLKEHIDILHKAHADFDQVVEKLPDWIKTQPAILQPALTDAYDKGNTQQVLDLVAFYKSSTGAVNTAADDAVNTAADAAAKKKAADAAEEKRKKADAAAAALIPVDSKRTTAAPSGKGDPNDFDTAFEEAAAAVAGGK